MFRRKPTRIECKIEDLDEWQSIKRDKEAEKKDGALASNDGLCLEMTDSETPSGSGPQNRREDMHRRIGYDPTPTP
ncbi:hypothetical protein CAPTEDRAFT_59569, partial [Capitella teleta]